MDSVNLEEIEYDEYEDDEEKSTNRKRILIGIVILSLIMYVIMYFTNPRVKLRTDAFLSRIPGPIGRYFQGNPTSSEQQEMIEYLSEHFLNLDADQAADKLYIIKKEDEKLYSEIIKNMNMTAPDKTEEIVLKLRNLELRKDLLISTYDQAREDEENFIRSEASRIEGQELLTSKREIERRFASSEFIEILDEMDKDILAEILYFVDPDIRNYITGKFTNKKRMDIELEISKIAKEYETLESLAKYYETKNVDVALKALGNEDSYSIEKLAAIYKDMSVLKSSMILAELDDNEFIENLFNEIALLEALLESDENVAQDMSRSIEFLNEYYSKVNNLTKAYEDMNAAKVGKIVEIMIENDESVTIFNLDSENLYELTDRTIIIDILSKMKKEQLSKVLDSMSDSKASEVTRLLAKPSERIFKGGEPDEFDGNVEPAEENRQP